mmetsp:Transcript_6148/g.17453  ORF Transcript_6148/g.17453 Transcript_6148/m.17453 type:complete len:193 (-) Transcript_6148:210-788(-)|eukprot:CAMPEP_0172359042 /NCGR_PEP_ID=MMETSP1060-20121228/3276_1 /TAXON_ID=37318 /ORGANISM="Pseudo-nitzschia pungens, Strain cf. cingulata" /LENGTH=192 /DNA_ID=CAMNT_0013080495 /DNA_START=88 /DNA_END=666 /DNA_ORIENTATION=+
MASHSLLRLAGSAAAAPAHGRRTIAIAAASRGLEASSSLSSSPSSSSSFMSASSSASSFASSDHSQRRSFWMDVVRIKPQRQRKGKRDNNNSNSAKFKIAHEDPEQVVRRHTDEVRADGENLLDLMFFNDRHEKAWMKRKRLQNLRRYEFDKKHVNDLAKYIAFVQDYGENENENEDGGSSSKTDKAPPKKK